MFRKLISTLLCSLLMLLLLCGCGASPEAQSVIDKINSINDVSYDSESLIVACEDAYYALTVEQQQEVSNLNKLSKARSELDQLLELRPTPFCNANWQTTQKELIEMMGNPDSENDTDNGEHVLKYENYTYEGNSGSILFTFTEDTLDEARFLMSEYDDQIYNRYQSQFQEKYGEPGYQSDIGKVWFTSNANIGIMGITLGKGYTVLVYHSPSEE